MDNGPRAGRLARRDWCRLAGTATTYIEPGSPWENPFVESFNGRPDSRCTTYWVPSAPRERPHGVALAVSAATSSLRPWIPIPDLPGCDGNDEQTHCRRPLHDLIQIQSGRTLATPVLRSITAGPISTTPVQFEEFVIDGRIEEHDTGLDCVAIFPDRTEPVESSGVVAGASLKPGAQSLSLTRHRTCTGSRETMEVVLHLSYIAA